MKGLWGEEIQSRLPLHRKATSPAQPTRSNPLHCQYFGHTWHLTGLSNEKQCTVCGLKSYCPGCTSRPPQGAQPLYCTVHLPAGLDVRLHPPDNPFCYNPSCPCHRDPSLIEEVYTFLLEGLLTPQEAEDFLAGKMV